MNYPRIIAYIAVPGILLSGFFVLQGFYASVPKSAASYRYSLYSFLCVVLLMEARVLLGKRGKRDTIFYLHLMSGVCTISILGVLGFSQISPLREMAALFFSAVSITTGLFLLHRSS